MCNSLFTSRSQPHLVPVVLAAAVDAERFHSALPRLCQDSVQAVTQSRILQHSLLVEPLESSLSPIHRSQEAYLQVTVRIEEAGLPGTTSCHEKRAKGLCQQTTALLGTEASVGRCNTGVSSLWQ